MQERSFGNSALRVTRLGLGLAAAGRPGYINLGHAEDLGGDYAVEAMRAQAEALLDAAYDVGIRYFDAARSYGEAEAFLGGWLRSRKIAPESVAVGSKWGYTYTANWQVCAERHEVKDHTLSVLRRQWQETQERLGGYLDLYQIHSATLESGVLDDTSVLDELVRLKANGVLIGLSLSGPKQAETLRKAIPLRLDGVRLFDGVQATWNTLERAAGAALAEAHAAGMGVIVKEALANGRLTTRNAETSFAPQRAVLEREARRLDTTLDGLALAAALAEPWADVVLSGAAITAQLRSNLGALDVGWDEQAATALATMVETPEAYWAMRSRLPWN